MDTWKGWSLPDTGDGNGIFGSRTECNEPGISQAVPNPSGKRNLERQGTPDPDQQLGSILFWFWCAKASGTCGCGSRPWNGAFCAGWWMVWKEKWWNFFARRLVSEWGKIKRNLKRTGRKDQCQRFKIRALDWTGNDEQGQWSVPCTSGLASGWAGQADLSQPESVCSWFFKKGSSGIYRGYVGKSSCRSAGILHQMGFEPYIFRGIFKWKWQRVSGKGLPQIRSRRVWAVWAPDQPVSTCIVWILCKRWSKIWPGNALLCTAGMDFGWYRCDWTFEDPIWNFYGLSGKLHGKPCISVTEPSDEPCDTDWDKSGCGLLWNLWIWTWPFETQWGRKGRGPQADRIYEGEERTDPEGNLLPAEESVWWKWDGMDDRIGGSEEGVGRLLPCDAAGEHRICETEAERAEGRYLL